jgi:hypothetical protein
MGVMVLVDPQRGHITLTGEGEAASVTFVDLGPVLSVWQYAGGVELDHLTAKQLGTALVAWADRKAARQKVAS